MADIAAEAGVQPDLPVLDGAARLCGYLWQSAWEQAPGTVDGDAEALHDMRVAVRRLRSALENLEGEKDQPLCGAQLRREFAVERRRLRKLGDALGAVRDRDVLSAYVADYIKTRLHGSPAPGLEEFAQHLQDERTQRFGPLAKRIKRGLEPGRRREKFARYLLGLPAATGSALTLAEAARTMLPLHIARVVELSAALDDPANEIGQHELRKAIKRLRYTLEFFAPCFEKPVKRKIKKLTAVQDCLGEMNDRTVLRDAVQTAFDGHTLPPDVAAFLAYGERRRSYLLGRARRAWAVVAGDLEKWR